MRACVSNVRVKMQAFRLYFVLSFLFTTVYLENTTHEKQNKEYLTLKSDYLAFRSSSSAAWSDLYAWRSRATAGWSKAEFEIKEQSSCEVYIRVYVLRYQHEILGKANKREFIRGRNFRRERIRFRANETAYLTQIYQNWGRHDETPNATAMDKRLKIWIFYADYLVRHEDEIEHEGLRLMRQLVLDTNSTWDGCPIAFAEDLTLSYDIANYFYWAIDRFGRRPWTERDSVPEDEGEFYISPKQCKIIKRCMEFMMKRKPDKLYS